MIKNKQYTRELLGQLRVSLFIKENINVMVAHTVPSHPRSMFVAPVMNTFVKSKVRAIAGQIKRLSSGRD